MTQSGSPTPPSPSAGRSPLLEMQDIQISFGGVPALRNANLSVAAGEVHALIGQNGAGKSTMIKILTGAYRRGGGTVRFEGREIDFRTPKEAREAGISTIYQEINLVPFRSVAENIFLGREPRRYGLIDWRAVQQRAAALLESFGLQIDVKKPVRSYSTAIQQMVALARAVSSDAKMVIMDESTSSLDEREVELLFTVVRKLRDDGRAVIFVSHRLDELYALCDRVTVMRDGQTVAQSTMAEMDKLQLVTTMLGRTLAAVVQEDAAAREANLARRGAQVMAAHNLSAHPKVTDVSLEVHAGEAVGLAGLLGSGRTETMRLMFGADPLEQGTLAVGGETVTLKSPQDAIARGLAYLTEDRKGDGIVPELSVRDNLTLVCLRTLAKHGVVDVKKQQAIVDRFIASLGIKLRSPDQPIRELSGGNQQKVVIGRWLARDCQVLLFDEPTRGIDVGAKFDIYGLMGALAREGRALVVVSSDLRELMLICDRIGVMSAGRMTGMFERASWTQDALLAAAFAGYRARETLLNPASVNESGGVS